MQCIRSPRGSRINDGNLHPVAIEINESKIAGQRRRDFGREKIRGKTREETKRCGRKERGEKDDEEEGDVYFSGV